MVKAGRSIAAAIAAGTYYRIEVYSAPNEWGQHRTLYRYDPPACETVGEVASCFIQNFGTIPDNTVATAYRIKGGSIGAYLVEDVGDVTALLRSSSHH